ncbi:hypothetical protein B0T20DRAFT_332386, partial [Sordaria brevicollis]
NTGILGRLGLLRVSTGDPYPWGGSRPALVWAGCCGAFNGTLRWRPITPFLDSSDNSIGN